MTRSILPFGITTTWLTNQCLRVRTERTKRLLENCHAVYILRQGLIEKRFRYEVHTTSEHYSEAAPLYWYNICRVKPNTGENVTKKCVYSIPQSYGREYKSGTGQRLKVILEEHRKAVVRQWNHAWLIMYRKERVPVKWSENTKQWRTPKC